MMRRSRWFPACAILALTAMMQPVVANADDAQSVSMQPRSSDLVARMASNPAAEPMLTYAEKLLLLRQKVKYVFVLFQENRSFDFHFGTFPGANGPFTRAPADTPGFVQRYLDTTGNITTISPFLIPQTVKDVNGNTVLLYPADTDSTDHTHRGTDNDIDANAATGVSLNDRFALNAEGLTTNAAGQIVSLATGLPPATPPTLRQKQRAELVMSHIDCDTIPFLWQFADRFTLFDNFFQTVLAPSAPNAVAIIAGQSGVTQWALHPDLGSNNTANPAVLAHGSLPLINNAGPFSGSDPDRSAIKAPYGPHDASPVHPSLNQTSATLPLSFMGRSIATTIQADENPALDLLDIQQDIRRIASDNLAPVNWGWYQEGYDHEPTDGNGPATRATYSVHHNAPQYFGYIGDNPTELKHLHGLGDFFTDISSRTLPAAGGVFYVRGGYGNNDGLTPLDKNPTVQSGFSGSDDHPGYADAQISEALIADAVNAIASSPYWKDSAIIITYDEGDGLYDHALPHIRQFDPEGNPVSGGLRVPAIVISAYGRAHVVAHQYSEHSSVIKFINELFGLTPLTELPDEQRGREQGLRQFGQPDLGPADALPSIDDLFDAFDNARLTGKSAPLAADYAMIPIAAIKTLPHYGGNGCRALDIIPTDYRNGVLIDPAPADFNPRPGTTPGIPVSGTWTP